MDKKINPVNWFEIPVNDIVRAKKFYDSVFGLELSLQDMGLVKMAWFPMMNDTYGAAGSLVKGDGYIPSRLGTIVYFSVDDIPATLAKINSQGGKIIFPKTAIGEYGFIAHFEDSEGNRVALHSMK